MSEGKGLANVYWEFSSSKRLDEKNETLTSWINSFESKLPFIVSLKKVFFIPFIQKNARPQTQINRLFAKYTHNSESISIRMNLRDATVRPLVSILRALGFIFSELEILDNGKLSIRLEMEEVIKVFSIQIVDFLFSRVVIEFENSRTWRNDHL